MKFIVTMPATTKVAMLIEAENEDAAEAEAIRLVRAGREDLLVDYLDPAEFVEVDESVDETVVAAPLGYADRRAANEPLRKTPVEGA